MSDSDIPMCECGTFWVSHHPECPVRTEIERLRDQQVETISSMANYSANAIAEAVAAERERWHDEVERLRADHNATMLELQRINNMARADAVEAERKAIAEICDAVERKAYGVDPVFGYWYLLAIKRIIEAIRARGEQQQ